jgi:hypothetical protein
MLISRLLDDDGTTGVRAEDAPVVRRAALMPE